VKRVAIFGSQGQLGQELADVFAKRGYETACFDRSCVDITDAEGVGKAVASYAPALVLNAAAYNKVDLAENEPDVAYRVNSLAVRNLAQAAHAADAKFITYSTDYVFDGTGDEPYREHVAPRPLSAYAVSKLSGEFYAMASSEQSLVIRTCGVFGPYGRTTAGGNFVETMLRLAASEKPIRVVEDFIASPTYAPALAARTADLVEADASGIFHVGGGEPITWFDWARKIFAAAGVTPDVKATNAREFPTPAERPRYSALSNAKMTALGIAPMPSLDEAIRSYLDRRATAASA
jgi:dTDP-4-dehydrorhamnose reductase